MDPTKETVDTLKSLQTIASQMADNNFMLDLYRKIRNRLIFLRAHATESLIERSAIRPAP